VPANPAFDKLAATAQRVQPKPPINVPEAIQFRRLYTVGNYVLAQVPQAIQALNVRLTSNTDSGAPVFINKGQLVQQLGAEIDAILKLVNEESNTRDMIEREIRAWFDLGTASAPNVNTQFRSVLREFATICADDLFGVDPILIESNNAAFDPATLEKLVHLYRDAKRRLIELVRLMSMSGTLGSDRLLAKWADVIDRAINVLEPAGQFVASDDADDRFIWSLVAGLVNQPRERIEAYVVHARDAGPFLEDAITVYLAINQAHGLANEDPQFLKQIFGGKDVVFKGSGLSAAVRLRSNATLALENWPWG
jgi:hypothetical protein